MKCFIPLPNFLLVYLSLFYAITAGKNEFRYVIPVSKCKKYTWFTIKLLHHKYTSAHMNAYIRTHTNLPDLHANVICAIKFTKAVSCKVTTCIETLKLYL